MENFYFYYLKHVKKNSNIYNLIIQKNLIMLYLKPFRIKKVLLLAI